MRIGNLAAVAALGVAALGLSGCASGLSTQVSRYQALPAPAGQTFYVVPANGPSGLQFGQYASHVSQQLQAQGYRPAGAPQLADMLVRIDYGVDQGQREIVEDPFAYSRYGRGLGWGRSGYDPFFRSRYDPFWGAWYGRPYYSRYGYYGRRSPYYYGWDDPFWYASPYAGYGYGYGGAIRSYTVYKSYLDMNIVRRVDNAPLFEGHAKARSQTDELGILVPNLIDAMFTGFPGRSGETVRITVPARRG